MAKSVANSKTGWRMNLYTIFEDGGLSGIWTYSTNAGDNVSGSDSVASSVLRSVGAAGRRVNSMV
jgi:hypothetical protein